MKRWALGIFLSAAAALLASCNCGAPACGPSNCTGCCTAAGMCSSGNTGNACGNSGMACAVCSGDQSCVSSTCTTTNHQQQTCNASNCANGCCTSTGVCLSPANTIQACGAGGGACQVCGNTQSCVGGVCQGGTGCSAANCNGCCTPNGSCISPANTTSACGVNGSACQVCNNGQSCSGGICTGGTGCSPANCGGCCNTAGSCVGGTSTAGCGINGGACAVCTANQTCAGGACVTQTGGLVVVPLTGCATTTYSAPVKIGSGTYQLIVDTGSTSTAVAANTCSNCTGVSPLYGNSGTNQNVPASSTFADGTGWNGTVYSDTVDYLGGPAEAVTMRFASISSQNGFFRTFDCNLNQTNTANDQGITGMSNPDLLLPSTDAYFQTLVTASGLPAIYAFQLCHANGTLWLGGYDASKTAGAMQYSPIASSPYIDVGLNDMSFAGTSVFAADVSPATVDTGTSVIGLPADVYGTLTAAIEGNSTFQSALQGAGSGFFAGQNCLSLGNGITSTAQLDATLPPLVLTLPSTAGGTFTLSAKASQSYLMPVSMNGAIVYCPALVNIGQTILGDTFLTGYVTVFDLASNRIGFAPQSGCTPLPEHVSTASVGPVQAHYRNPWGPQGK